MGRRDIERGHVSFLMSIFSIYHSPPNLQTLDGFPNSAEEFDTGVVVSGWTGEYTIIFHLKASCVINNTPLPISK